MRDLTDAGRRQVREQIGARCEALRERLRRVCSRQEQLEPGARFDEAILLDNQRALRRIEALAREELRELEIALERLEAPAPACCERCAEAIDPGRLRILPAARICGPCASGPAELSSPAVLSGCAAGFPS